jgi:putative pyruvate formate lyase activating enzyme
MRQLTMLARLDRANAQFRCCALCEHRCQADRVAGQKGPCKAGTVARVFRHRVEYSEESELVPSHLFYLSGCDLRCVFCIAEINAFDPSRGRELTSPFFNDAVNFGIAQGARTLQWVGGEPTIHLPVLLDVMSRCPNLPPIAWKSDFYGTPEAFSLLEGIVGTYVADYKFGNDDCARRLAGVDNYVAVVQRNLRIAAAQTRLIVRHLLLPGHEECCYQPILKWMSQHLPDAAFSLRDGYLPHWRAASYPEIAIPMDRIYSENAARQAVQYGLKVIQ